MYIKPYLVKRTCTRLDDYGTCFLVQPAIHTLPAFDLELNPKTENQIKATNIAKNAQKYVILFLYKSVCCILLF